MPLRRRSSGPSESRNCGMTPPAVVFCSSPAPLCTHGCKYIVIRRRRPPETRCTPKGAKNGFFGRFFACQAKRGKTNSLNIKCSEFCVFSEQTLPRGVSGDSRAFSARRPRKRNVLLGPEQRVALAEATRCFSPRHTKRETRKQEMSGNRQHDRNRCAARAGTTFMAWF